MKLQPVHSSPESNNRCNKVVMYLVNTKGERGKFTTRDKDPPP